jgi:hypothetical protein
VSTSAFPSQEPSVSEKKKTGTEQIGGVHMNITGKFREAQSGMMRSHSLKAHTTALQVSLLQSMLSRCYKDQDSEVFFRLQGAGWT